MKNLTVKNIEGMDKQNMLDKLKEFPAQCKEGYSFPLPQMQDRKFKNVIFCGMGGSAVGGNIISTVAYESSGLPCMVNSDYSLPLWVGRETLVVITSYSGDTEETVSAMKSAKKKGSGIIAISSNGKIENLAASEKIPFIKIPGGYPPRCALGYIFFPIYRMISSLGIVPELHTEIFNRIKKWTAGFLPDRKNNLALNITEKFYDRVPLIYSGTRLLPAITRWKTQIAENSKSFAFINVFPEMNHNEIMSWHYPRWFIKKCVPVFITSGNEHPRTKLRFEITKNIISQIQPDIVDIKVKGRTLLEEIFYLIVLGDWVSFYLAILNRVNPTEIKEISLLKKQMGGKR